MPARARTALAAAVAAALVFALGGLALGPLATAAAQSYVATVNVNVRSGPSVDDQILGVLNAGSSLPAAGPAADGWQPVTYAGRTAYIKATFLREATASTPVSPTSAASSPTATQPSAAPTDTTITITPTGPRGTATALVDLNLRTAPSLDSTVVSVVPKGTAVTLTGNVTERFSQVSVSGALRWLSTRYLQVAATPTSTSPSPSTPSSSPSTTPPAPAPATPPTVKGTAIAAIALTLRGSASNTAASYGAVPSGARVQLTGNHSGSYSEILWSGVARWVLTGYLTSVSSVDALASLPSPTAKRYVIAAKTPVLAGADATSSVVDTLDPPAVLLLTGKAANGYSQVIYSGALRWIATAKLSTTKPADTTVPTTPTGSLGSASLDRTNAYAKAIVLEIRARFPQIKTIYGWRSYSAYSSDHPSGRALDIMIPGYSTASGKALGDAIALFLQQNHAKFHVHYLIWRQRNWNVERDTSLTAWRWMSDRGGTTANHYDHVHVSVYAVP